MTIKGNLTQCLNYYTPFQTEWLATLCLLPAPGRRLTHRDRHTTWTPLQTTLPGRAQRLGSPTTPRCPPKSRHQSTGQFPPSQPTSWMQNTQRQEGPRLVDPLGAASARPQYHDTANLGYDSDENDDIHTRVAHLLTSHLAPLGSAQGKKHFAYFYVRRGSKRAKTSLGDLNVPEYNLVS